MKWIVVIFIILVIIVVINKLHINYWQYKLDPNTLLSNIWLPGTHDSLAYNVFMPYIAKTQSMNLFSQLKNGIRLFDIRLHGHDLVCCHGIVNCKNRLSQNITYKDVLQNINRFINNTDEFVVLTITKEYDDISDDEFINHTHELHRNNNIIELKETNVSISILKGHACVINRLIKDVNRQDIFYIMNVSVKKTIFKNALRDHNIQLNASNIYLFPRLFSLLINNYIRKEILKATIPQWFMIDFPNQRLINTIINKNS